MKNGSKSMPKSKSTLERFDPKSPSGIFSGKNDMRGRKRHNKEAGTVLASKSTFEGGDYGLRSLEGGIGDVSREIWRVFHHAPGLGAVVTAGLGVGVAMAVGVGELVVGVVAGYVGYRMSAYGECFTEAVEKSIRLEEGSLSSKELMKRVPK
jgi:hypothetical protein